MDLYSCTYFNVCLDENTHFRVSARLAIRFRFVKDKEACE